MGSEMCIRDRLCACLQSSGAGLQGLQAAVSDDERGLEGTSEKENQLPGGRAAGQPPPCPSSVPSLSALPSLSFQAGDSPEPFSDAPGPLPSYIFPRPARACYGDKASDPSCQSLLGTLLGIIF